MLSIKDGFKFGVGFVLGGAVMNATAKILLKYIGISIEKVEKSVEEKSEDKE